MIGQAVSPLSRLPPKLVPVTTNQKNNQPDLLLLSLIHVNRRRERPNLN
jgi:hypothetical protein